MNKFLYIVFGLVLFAAVVLGGYYFYSIRTGKSVSRTSTLLPPSPTPANGAGAWSKIIQRISSDCKTISATSARDANSQIADTSKLFGALGSDVTYDNSAQSFAAPKGTLFDIQYVRSGGSSLCLAVWVGNVNGAGRVAYELSSGDIKQLSVTNYPLPPQAPPSAPAIPTP
jgi:hypothetical protein